MLPWVSCKVTQKNVNIGGSFSLTNKSNLPVAWWKKIHGNRGKKSWMERNFYKEWCGFLSVGPMS